MRCPFCSNLEDRVVDSRESREGEVIRRRRECTRCERRFTSYEKIEVPLFQVVKRDQRREAYDRAKLMRGLQIACRKRPVRGGSVMVAVCRRSILLRCPAGICRFGNGKRSRCSGRGVVG